MGDKITISVIIPTINDKHLNKTIAGLYDAAEEEIEVIVVLDGCKQLVDSRASFIYFSENRGKRVAINEAARMAHGEYLFVLDAHCSMSKSWDKKLVETCGPRNIVVCAIRDMNPKTWEYLPGVYNHVRLNQQLEEKWSNQKVKGTVEEMMCFTGCAWIISNDYYWLLGGFNEYLGNWGWEGPEWAMKVWLHPEYPGKVLLRSDVICGHIFGTNVNNACYQVKTIGHASYYKKMMDRWGSRLYILFRKFPELDSDKEFSMNAEKKVCKTVIEKKDDVVKRDGEDKVVSHIVKHYKPYTCEHDGSKSDEQITKEALPLITEVEREEVLV